MSRPPHLAAFLLPFTTLTTLVAPAHAADYLSDVQARAVLFPEATGFVDQALVFTPAQRERIKALAGMAPRAAGQAVWRAEKDGRAIGWFIVDEVVGKSELITYATALSPDGRVLGVEIMNYRESHGGQVRNAAWRAQFAGKTPADIGRLDGEVSNISGATLSCHHLVDGVKRLLAVYSVALGPAGRPA